MTDRMLLDLGAQTSAAQVVDNAAVDVAQALSTLGKTLEAAAPGFTGGAAAAFGGAVNAWFTVAVDLPVALQQYAAALAAVDQAVAAVDTKSTSSLSASGTGLSGLNLGVEP